MNSELHDDDVLSVPKLRAACLTTISTELWNNWNASELLAAYVENIDKTSKSVCKTKEDSHYFIIIERIFSKIMQSSLPDRLRLQLATAFYEHQQRMIEWAQDIKKILKDVTESNIHYGIAKTVVTQHGNIDKARSILKMMLESYLRIRIQEFTISICVFINKQVLKSFLRSQKYANYRIWLKKMKICTSFIEPLNIIMHFFKMDNDLPPNKLILVETYKNASLQLWNFVLTKLEKNNPEMYFLTLAHSLIRSHPDTKKVIQIYEDFDEDLQKKVIKNFGIQLVELMFRNNEIIGVEMFNQVCRYYDTQTCSELLERIILCSLFMIVPNSEQTTKVLKMRSKQMLLKLWYQTPNTVKQELLMKPGKYLFWISIIIGEGDYHLFSILVTVNTCSQEHKNKLIIAAIAILAGKPLEIEKCLKELPEYYNMKFVKDNMRSMLKQCLCLSEENYNYDALTNLAFDSQHSTDEFKRTLFCDKEFVTDALCNLALKNKEKTVMAFLNWGFNNNNIALKHFIDEKIKSEQWIVALYQKYLCKTKDYTDFLLSLFLANEEEETKIKMIIRQDRDMILRALHLSANSKYFLRCIFDKDEKKQKCELVEEYFSSESGSKRLYDLLTESVSTKHFILYFRYELTKVIKSMFTFKKHWLVSVRARDIIDEVVQHEKIQEHIQNNKKSLCEVWLPFENERQLKAILDTNVRLFKMIMNSDTPIRSYLQELKGVHMLGDFQQTAELYLHTMGSYI